LNPPIKPLTPQQVTANELRLAEPYVTEVGFFWLQSLPDQAGRMTLMSQQRGQTLALLPVATGVRSHLHEYGGGAYCVGDSAWFFVDDADQQIYQGSTATQPSQLTETDELNYGDLNWDQHGRRLLCIAESKQQGVADQLLSINQTGKTELLFQEGDFLSSPSADRVSGALTWLSWDRPQMPWTQTRLHWTDGADVRSFSADGVSIFQPQWGPDGKLYFIADFEGWWNLFRLDDGAPMAVTQLEAEIGLPQWVGGMSVYGFLDAKTILAAVNRAGTWSLAQVKLSTGAVLPLALPDYSQIDALRTHQGEAVLLTGGPQQSLSIVRFCNNQATKLQSSSNVAVPHWHRPPEPMQFATSHDQVAYGFHYSPPAATAPPPLLVVCHGGPTAGASTALDPRVLFWLSNGFAVLDVNYRGSTGFGRAYRESLYGQWGLFDVDDCVYGARALADRGQVDPQRMFIRGSSAGGLTVLNALAQHRVFAAGTSYYGVTDLTTLFAMTARFEQSYDRWLLGEDSLNVARQRSPQSYSHKIKAPVLFFQGGLDRVVPAEQSLRLYDSLKQQGTPVCYQAFDEEGHGFRDPHTLAQCLTMELGFYQQIMGATPAVTLAIDNWP